MNAGARRLIAWLTTATGWLSSPAALSQFGLLILALAAGAAAVAPLFARRRADADPETRSDPYPGPVAPFCAAVPAAVAAAHGLCADRGG